MRIATNLDKNDGVKVILVSGSPTD